MSAIELQKIHIVSVAHGWRVANHFISICLPNLIPLISEMPPSLISTSKVRIFATDKDIVFIRNNPYFSELEALIETELVSDIALPVVPKPGDQGPLNTVQGRAVVEASAAGAALIFLPATAIFAQGSFAAIIKHAQRGCRALVSPLLRAKLEPTVAELEGLYAVGKNKHLSISNNDLARVIHNNWHPINDQFCIQSTEDQNKRQWMPYILERTGEYETLARLFHAPLFFAWPNKTIQYFDQSIDQGLAGLCCHSQDEFHILDQSDGFLACDLSPTIDTENTKAVSSGRGVSFLRQFMNLDGICRLQLYQGKQTIRIHCDSPWSSKAIAIRQRIATTINPLLYIALVTRPFLRILKISISGIGRIATGLNRILDSFFPFPEPAPVTSSHFFPEPETGETPETEIPAKLYDFTVDERQTYQTVAGMVCGGPEAVTSVIRAVDYLLANNIQGSFVECGVFKGANIIVMMRTLLSAKCIERDIFLYDTFQGMPEPEDVDIYYDGQPARQVWESTKDLTTGGSNWVCSPIDEVRKNVELVGYPMDKVFFIEGLVEETLPDRAPSEIALLRLDTDFYRSTKHELTHLFPRLVKGGILIIDDYGAFSGAKAATDEFFKESGIAFFLGRVDEHVRIGVKI